MTMIFPRVLPVIRGSILELEGKLSITTIEETYSNIFQKVDTRYDYPINRFKVNTCIQTKRDELNDLAPGVIDITAESIITSVISNYNNLKKT